MFVFVAGCWWCCLLLFVVCLFVVAGVGVVGGV